MKKRISLVVLVSISFLIAFVEYVSSFGSYDDGGYRGFYADENWSILVFSLLILLICSVVNLIGYLKKKSYEKEVMYSCLAVSGLNAGYGLFTALKIVGKAVSKLWENEAFELAFSDVSLYLAWFALAGALTVYLVFTILEKKKA